MDVFIGTLSSSAASVVKTGSLVSNLTRLSRCYSGCAILLAPRSPHHFPPFLHPNLPDSLGAPLRGGGKSLGKSRCLRECFFDPFYDLRDLSRFEIACRKILDKRSVSDLPQNGDVLHKHPGIGPMPGKGHM
jgi:hypothetical protein